MHKKRAVQRKKFCLSGQSPGGFLTVDFLTGSLADGTSSSSLGQAVALCRDALPALCEKHGTSPSAFRELTARYSIDRHGPRFVVAVADQHGHRSADEFEGWEGRSAKVLDHLGRVRPK